MWTRCFALKSWKSLLRSIKDVMHGIHQHTGNQVLRDSDFRVIIDLVYRHAGISLGPSKKNLVVSRLGHRLRQLGMTSFSEYVNYVNSKQSQKDELRQFINAITTNTTHFFREPHHFAFLKKMLEEKIRSAKLSKHKRVRIWCAASSTGQEPYSIAMTVERVFHGRSDWDVKLMASDIDTNALSIASEGEYTASEMRGVSESDRSRFFSYRPDTGIFRVKPILRKRIVFRKVNLIYDALDFHEPISVVFCRNVIIYFSAEDRAKLLARMHQTLADDGILFLGHSESIPYSDTNFEYLDTTVYRKRCDRSHT